MKHLLSCLFFALALVTAPVSWSADENAAQATEQVERLSVNINTASEQQLSEQLKGIGPAKAKAIIEYRQAHGEFSSPDALMEVKGIGPSTLDKNRDLIKV
ncbi:MULTISPECIES: helix-hairpin-helix domain-containing protein [unclassified Salinivibrio]|uniref:ComEA family DNA-binding protein n=1 Tax=unclassified Salinivibrio TaxID=2636825 RepID=UPI0009C8000D|nr:MULTISPECIES: helix-hairpin-helix domain-containing protein [unclassified Salinivibrio]MPS32540.1 helix-hairpin-helix domain-containing protein [Salinivibrio sp. VYel7]MPX90539.1 helix-hairpin-helix domain-containing protein [Salinivibrio sp. VYel1]MPX93931.1 helix-hairpin-helix domain-containing protein [Salinivibrio sp. VYel9]MPX96168.1 helix-hairpin-helix domain-containing protein [Salinivibrio sp. VYel6]MPY00396.1 helix-hairpin-helix domain-containing protein [Salinivibrio sp. VYel4]